MRKNKTSPPGSPWLFGIIRTYATTLVRVVIFEVELILPDSFICNALLFLIKSAVSGRGSLRGQLWCSSVFGFLSSPKRAFQRGGSHSGFQTLTQVKGRHNKAQQPNLLRQCHAHMQGRPLKPLAPAPRYFSLQMILPRRAHWRFCRRPRDSTESTTSLAGTNDNRFHLKISLRQGCVGG